MTRSPDLEIWCLVVSNYRSPLWDSARDGLRMLCISSARPLPNPKDAGSTEGQTIRVIYIQRPIRSNLRYWGVVIYRDPGWVLPDYRIQLKPLSEVSNWMVLLPLDGVSMFRRWVLYTPKWGYLGP